MTSHRPAYDTHTPRRWPGPGRLAVAAVLVIGGCTALLVAFGAAAAPLVAVVAGLVLILPLQLRPPLPQHLPSATGSGTGTGAGAGADTDPLSMYPPVYRRWVRTTAGADASIQDLLDRAAQHSSWWEHRCRNTHRSLESVETDLDPARLPTLIARHEAAHALVAHDMGATVLELTYDTQDGHCMAIWTHDQTQPDRLWTMMTYNLAGVASDQREGAFNTGSQQDLDQVHDLTLALISLGRSPSEHHGPLTSDALITSARRRALEVLQRSPDRHGELAEALLHEGPTLPGLRIAEILGSPR